MAQSSLAGIGVGHELVGLVAGGPDGRGPGRVTRCRLGEQEEVLATDVETTATAAAAAAAQGRGGRAGGEGVEAAAVRASR